MSDLSSFTQNLIGDNFKPSQNVITSHTFPKYQVIHSEYYLFLKENFGFEPNYELLHFLTYQTKPLMTEKVSQYLKMRSELKSKLSSTLIEEEKIKISQACLLYKIILNR